MQAFRSQRGRTGFHFLASDRSKSLDHFIGDKFVLHTSKSEFSEVSRATLTLRQGRLQSRAPNFDGPK